MMMPDRSTRRRISISASSCRRVSERALVLQRHRQKAGNDRTIRLSMRQ
jgi:hypothetical protein